MTDNSVPHIDRSNNSVSSSILERARLGDQEAFQVLTKLYAGLVYHWCRSKGLNKQDAEDTSQQVFLSISKSIRQFRREKPEDSFRAWIRIITRSKIADHFRKAACNVVALGEDIHWHTVADDILSEEESEENQQLTTSMLYQRAMQLVQQEFTEVDCKAFLMAVVEGLPAKEISEKLQVSTNSVYIAKSRILKRLRTEFSELIDD